MSLAGLSDPINIVANFPFFPAWLTPPSLWGDESPFWSSSSFREPCPGKGRSLRDLQASRGKYSSFLYEIRFPLSLVKTLFVLPSARTFSLFATGAFVGESSGFSEESTAELCGRRALCTLLLARSDSPPIRWR